jgi:CheY-like chemotaxis protein
MMEQLGVLPRRDALKPAPQLATGPAGEEQTVSRPRVLLAEDNEINELLARRILEKCGCEVVTVRNGLEAVAAMRAVCAGSAPPFALVLMDILMPELDGVEATGQIKDMFAAAPSHTATLPPIVALTANAFVEDRRRYLDAGMDDYLAKPFDKQAIEELISRWIGRTGTRGKAA